MSSGAALEVRGLRVAYGAHVVVDGLDLRVDDGSVAALLGPSGCGKTTLLRTIAGFVAPSAGTVDVAGRTVDDATDSLRLPTEQRRVGIVPQEGALFPHLDVARNIGFGLPRGDASRERVQHLLDLIGLPDAGRSLPAELSGGMQQRVALARALAPSPTLVLLDEPFSALDAGLRADLRDDVRALLEAESVTAVLVTHDQDEALSFADQVAVMRDGRVVQDGSPQDVYRHPVDLAVARFVGEVVELPAQVADGVAATAVGPVRTDGPVTDGPAIAVLRPEQLLLNPGDAEGAAEVLRLRFHGHESRALVRLADGAVVPVRLPGTTDLAVGSRVTITVDGTARTFPHP